MLVLLVSLCGCALLGQATETLFRAVSPKLEIPTHRVFTVLSILYSPLFIRISAIIGAVLLAPIGEELLFRGIMQTGLHKIFPLRHHGLYHRWASIVCVATLFGLPHLATPQNVPALIVLGVLLGYALRVYRLDPRTHLYAHPVQQQIGAVVLSGRGMSQG